MPRLVDVRERWFVMGSAPPLKLDDYRGEMNSLAASFVKFGGSFQRTAAHSIQLAVRERAMIFERGEPRSVVGPVHDQIHALAERILELSFGGATVKFENLLSKGAEIIQEAPPQLPKPDDPSSTAKLADVAARVLSREFAYRSVLPAYEMLAEEFARLGEQLGVKARDGMNIMRMLWKRGVISSEMVDLFDTLRQARNALVHARELPSSFAIEEYSRQAGYLLSELRIAGGELKNSPKQ